MGRWVFHFDCRFAADGAFPFVALNRVYRRRPSNKIGRFLKKKHVEGATTNASEIHDELRAGGKSALYRIRHFGGDFLRGTDAYWEYRPDDVDAWLHYHVEQGADPPAIQLLGDGPNPTGQTFSTG